MQPEKKTLSELLEEGETFVVNHGNESKLYLENTVLHSLRGLAFQAAAAATADPEIQRRYLETVGNLRDICVKLKHPNTLKEDPLYNRIKSEFPGFNNPLDCSPI